MPESKILRKTQITGTKPMRRHGGFPGTRVREGTVHHEGFLESEFDILLTSESGEPLEREAP